MFASELATLKRVGLRALLVQGLAILSVLTSALCMWKALALVADTETPVVVVLSGSMEPGFQRGDLLFLSRPASPYKIGDITVYNVPGSNGQATPIVHRVLEIHDIQGTTDQRILTKGDNNPSDDVGLYDGPLWLNQDDMVGKVQGYIPYVGYVTIVLNDYPKLKVALFGVLGLSLLFQGE